MDDLASDMLGVLHSLEWSGVRYGPGNGPMGSGGDGTRYDACPLCYGLSEPNGNFNLLAVGHRYDCPMLLVLERAKAAS